MEGEAARSGTPGPPSVDGGSPGRLAILLGLLLTLVIGLLDYLSGNEISFSVFYLAPTALIAWKGGRGIGLLGALFAATVWLVVDFASGYPYSRPWIIYWNATVRLVFFLVTALLIGRQKLVYSLERKLARTDVLTGLLNSRAFYEEGERVRMLCARNGHPLTMLYLDLDNFKQVNDRRGHQEGDRLIRLVGEGLRNSVRATDLACRLGGDEFGVLLPETGYDEAERFIARLRRGLDAVVDRGFWSLDYSVGVITFPTPPPNLDQATSLADRLMYEVKGAGKGRWEHRSA